MDGVLVPEDQFTIHVPINAVECQMGDCASGQIGMTDDDTETQSFWKHIAAGTKLFTITTTKKLGLMLDSSMEAESIGSSKAGELITYAREILRAMGIAADKPTVVMTDNKANLLVANDATSASRSRHFLRRYWALQQRIARGDCKLVKADDAWMPADFLTKWLSSAKLAKSIAYATNRRNAVAPNAHAS